MSERINRQFVYVMRSSSGLVKIGISQNVEKRRAELAGAGGHEVEIVQHFGPFYKAQLVEREAHRTLHPKRAYGEWFRCSPADGVAAVSQAVANFVEPNVPIPPTEEEYQELARHLVGRLFDQRTRPSDALSYDDLADRLLEAVALIDGCAVALAELSETNEILTERVRVLEGSATQLNLELPQTDFS